MFNCKNILKVVWTSTDITTGGYIFVNASHQTGLDSSSVTRRSIKVGIRGREGGRRIHCLAEIEGENVLKILEGADAENKQEVV